MSRAPTGPEGYRRIEGLVWVQLTDEGPIISRKAPRKASVKRGRGYERKVARALKREKDKLGGELFIGQWLLFKDRHGYGRAQPDVYILRPDLVVLIECKLTQTESVIPQLLNLYLPLIRGLYSRRVVCIQACHNLRYVPKKLIKDPIELIDKPRPGVWTWHYIG